MTSATPVDGCGAPEGWPAVENARAAGSRRRATRGPSSSVLRRCAGRSRNTLTSAGDRRSAGTSNADSERPPTDIEDERCRGWNDLGRDDAPQIDRRIDAPTLAPTIGAGPV